MIDRRNVLRSSAVVPAIALGAVSGQLATCSSSGGLQINPAVVDAIEKAVAQGCNFIPAFTTILGLVTATFPALIGATTITATVLAEVQAILCANIPNVVTGPKALANGVSVHGWVIQNGKLVYV